MVDDAAYAKTYVRALKDTIFFRYPKAIARHVVDNLVTKGVTDKMTENWRSFLERFGF